jgi:tocopherol cyclase
MIAPIVGRLHPEGYHGTGQKPPFFEGWYFKLVNSTGQIRYAIIPGISLGLADGGPHSFVQVLDGSSRRTVYLRYPVAAFSASRSTLDVRVGPNSFTWAGLRLDLRDSDLPLVGEIHFVDPKPWPVSLASPGIMGWYAWVPRMECYHGVLSFDHALRGSLTVADTVLDFAGGRGYIEKDWGKSFPSGWIWMQTNHFEKPGTCLTASIAMIPWIGHAFPGFIVGLFHEGTLYRFATYTGARTTHLSVTEDLVTWTMHDKLCELEIVAHASGAAALRGPSRSDMGRIVPETLSATVEVRLSTRRDRSVIFSGLGKYAGMEISGDYRPLLTSG